MKLTTTTNQVSSSKYSLEEMDRLYHTLRAEIVKGFETYMTSGSVLPLFNVDSKRISISKLASACIDEKHYNCNTCREFFVKASGYCYMDSEGNLISPILDAFNKVPELAVFVQDELASLNQKLNKGQAKPVRFLPGAVTNETKGFDQDNKTEWTHFYLANKALIDTYNAVEWEDASGQVKSFVEVFNGFSKADVDFETLKRIGDTIAAMLNMPSTIGLYYKLIELYDRFTKAKNKSTFLLGYLSSPKNAAVRHWKSSTANYVVEAIIYSQDYKTIDTKRLAENINQVTKGEVYKHQTKEVTEQHLETVVESLEKLGYGNILSRKPANPSDIPWFVMLDPVKTSQEKVEKPQSSLRQAALAVRGKQKDHSDVTFPETEKKISQEGLNKYLTENKDKIESLHLKLKDVIPTFFTKPTDDVDYSDVLKVSEDGILLSFITDPVSIRQICTSESINSIIKKVTDKGIPLDGFGIKNECLFFSSPINEIIKDATVGLGTLIIGAHIQNDKYEMANAIAKMSKSTPMDFSEATHSYFQSFFYSNAPEQPGTCLVVKEKGVDLYTVYSVVTKS